MKVSKLIHDLHEQVEENKSAIDECVFLRNENEGFLEEIKELKKENTDLRKIQDQDDLNRQITNLRIKQKELEKEITNFISTAIEWVPLNKVKPPKEKNEDLINFFMSLQEDDDVQNVYSNVEFKN